MANRSRGARWAFGIGITVTVYALVGFLLLPAIIKSQMLKRLPTLTKRAVTVQQVKLNPFALTLTIRGFTLRETNGDVFYSFNELYAHLRLVSIFKRVFVFKEIRLKKPFGSVIFQQDGKFNLSNLLSALPPKSKTKLESQELPHFVVERLSIEDGVLIFQDLNRKFFLKLTQIGLRMEGLSNQTKAPVPVVIAFLCNESGTVALQGMVSPFARSANVQVQVTNLELRAIQPYVEKIWNLNHRRCAHCQGTRYVCGGRTRDPARAVHRTAWRCQLHLRRLEGA